MTHTEQIITVECWCYGMKRQVKVSGAIVGERQATLLKVTDCEWKFHCAKRGDEDCLIGKVREGKWRT